MLSHESPAAGGEYPLDSRHCRRKIIDFIERFSKVCCCKVVGFCIMMPNHCHLMIESVRGNLNDGMKMLSSRYVQEMNRRPGWDGALFCGRFHNKVVYEDSHWRYLLAYIHLNPVKAGLASLSRYQWSSHAKYSGEVTWPDWLITRSLKTRMGGIGYHGFIERAMDIASFGGQARGARCC